MKKSRIAAGTGTEIGPRPPPDVAMLFRQVLSTEEAGAMDVLFQVRAACQLMDNTVQVWLGPDAISPSRMHVLMVLWAAGRPVPQTHVVEALEVSRPTISALVDGLARTGLVKSTVDESDKRRALVALTPAGRVLAKRNAHANASRMMTALADLSVDERLQLAALLDRARSSFEAHGSRAGRSDRVAR